MDLPAGALDADVVGDLGALQPGGVVVVVHRIDWLQRVRAGVAESPLGVFLVAAQCDAVGRQTRDRRRAGRDEGDEVAQAHRSLGDDVELVADLDVIPEARRGPPRRFRENVILDLLELLLRPRVRELDLARLTLGLHLGPLEPHPRADEGRDELVVLVAVLLTQIVLDAASSEVAGVDRAVETVEKYAGRDAVVETDRLVKLDVRLGVEAAEPAPADLHRPEASENETRRRDDPAERPRGSVLLVRPQRVVVADALAEPQNRHAVRELVVDRHGGA